MVRWLGGLCLAIALVACTSEDRTTTEALVVVDSDLKPGSELSEVRVRVFDDEGTTLSTDTLKLAADADGRKTHTLPLSFSITPGGAGDDAEFRLVVTGRGKAQGSAVTDLVEQQTRASFRAGMRTRVEVRLDRDCLAMLCRVAGVEPSDQTCVSGACSAVPTMEEVIAKDGKFGGYVARDGGVRDGSTPADGGGAADAATIACQSDDACNARLGKLEPEGCAVGRCTQGFCSFIAQDADGDGHTSAVCKSDKVDILLGDDCDDRNSKRAPGLWDGPAGSDQQDACDALDNDCNGKVDDQRGTGGKSCMCDPVKDIDVDCSERADGTAIEWPAGTPVGVCAYGKRSCGKDGVWGACNGAAEPTGKDSCNVPDDDSDCDGLKNEDCPCVTGAKQACGSDVGNCKKGEQTCSNGKWGACTGGVAALPRDTCDEGDDANCTGVPNQGCTCINGVESTCKEVASALGVCATRKLTCKGGNWDIAVCTQTSPETCADDNLDEDCDGLVNERASCECTNGKTSSCADQGLQGTCAGGTMTCANGKLSACSIPPKPKDGCTVGNDDNCNGVPFEGCECFASIDQRACPADTCPTGIQRCSPQGMWLACEGCN